MAGASAGAEGSDAAAEAVVALLPESMSVVLVLENRPTSPVSNRFPLDVPWAVGFLGDVLARDIDHVEGL